MFTIIKRSSLLQWATEQSFSGIGRFRAVDKKGLQLLNGVAYKMTDFDYYFNKLERFRAIDKKVYNYKMV